MPKSNRSRAADSDPFEGLRDQIINYHGCAATREQAYWHGLKMTGVLLSAERMAYGFDVPVLTAEQIARYVPFEALYGDG